MSLTGAPEKPQQYFTTSNQDYQEIFEAPLFLHRGNPDVCLRNLFVLHRFTIERGLDSDESMDYYLARFVRDTETRFLFIEGDAGCGKSSLAAYLSWHYGQRDQTAQEIFGDAQLLTVRLRNIEVPENGRRAERLALGVLRFLYGDKESDKVLVKRFRESGARVLLLDGYDELCMTDGIENPEASLKTLKNLDCKIIVTMRPKYVRFRYLEENYWHIALKHFNETQRREWLRRYENCGQTLGEVNRRYLERIGDGETAGICDTPMGLYMVAAGYFKPDMLENEWAVYRRIFYWELSETEYNQIFQDISSRHGVQEYQDLLYRVSEEIAWYLYQGNNENRLVPDSEISRIIRELDINGDERKIKILERSFALCGYWKADTERGFVEFYHQDIRDFFLCEKLMRELNGAYRKYGDALRDERGDITPFLRLLCELFQYGKLEKRTLFFLKQRAAYLNKEEPDFCVDTEREQRHTARIFETMLLRGAFYSVCAELWAKENPVCTIARILSNTIAAYRSLYESFLKPGEHIQWWANARDVNGSHTFRQLAGDILGFVGPSDLSGMDLDRTNLSGADFKRANLRYVRLESAILRFADLRGADLQGANLQGADWYGADLQGVEMENVNLRGANLENVDLNGANLQGADLQGANLENADLQGANLRNADLRGANLQGGQAIMPKAP